MAKEYLFNRFGDAFIERQVKSFLPENIEASHDIMFTSYNWPPFVHLTCNRTSDDRGKLCKIYGPLYSLIKQLAIKIKAK